MFNPFPCYPAALLFGAYFIMGSGSAVAASPIFTPYSVERNASSNDAAVSTPHNAEAILAQTLQLTPSLETNISNKSRILIKHGSAYMAANDSYGLELSASLSTYNDLLLKTFYPVEQKTAPCYRMDSEKHSIYSIDYDIATMKLTMRNNWGYGRNAKSAYLCFTFDSNKQTIIAKKRYLFNIEEGLFDEDKSFSSSFVYYDSTNSNFKLSSSGSSFSLQDSGFDFNVPKDFNPDGSEDAPNARAPWEKLPRMESFSRNMLSGDKLQKDTHSKYQPQIRVAGDDKNTRIAAQQMLQKIQIDLKSSGDSLRYRPAVYLAFRAALLNTKLKGATTVNGVIDQNTVPYVFFTNEADASGVKHPFMVIASYSISDKPNRLLDVPTPPGNKGGRDYYNQEVTRDAVLQTYMIKIPLKNYGNVSSLTENDMRKTLASDAVGRDRPSHLNVYNSASIASIGVAVDGVMIYPLLNNTLVSAQQKAEITNTGIHVGRGMGLHWHADGHGATGNGLNLYNLADYLGQVHPPVIGFGFDGIALYGKYEADYHEMDGHDDLLDSFGGHAHGNYGYHYHAHAAPSSVIGDARNYTLHILMKGAWIGKINSIPEFWKGNAPNIAGQRNRYVGSR